MLRLFNQHKIRRSSELNGIWQLAIDGTQTTMVVPGCWEQDPRFRAYRGEGTYSRTITVDDNADTIRFVFKGVSHTADVYLDGELLAHHYNAYTPFTATARAVSAGSHRLEVNVSNRFSPESALHIPNDYYSYGGISRGVGLEILPDLFIEHIHFTPSKEAESWRGKTELTLTNLSSQPQECDASLQLADESTVLTDLSVPAKSSRTFTWQAAFPQAQPWSPDSPQLYCLQAQLTRDGQPFDDLIERVGFRTVSEQGSQILLNGEPIFLKGLNRHEDFGTFGCALPLSSLMQDMEYFHDLGANAMRTCHYPNDERWLDLCDQEGLMVWEEHHTRSMSLEQMQNPNFDEQCRKCNHEMVTEHYNHPAIIIWGLLNECASNTAEGAAKYRQQFEQIESLDSSRPVTSASCQHFADRCLSLDKVVSTNLYSGWYEDVDIQDSLDKEVDWIYGDTGVKPLIISEFGGAALYGNHDPMGRSKWSEERQADILQQCLKIYLNDPRVSGVFIWQFADCRVTEEEWFLERPRLHNNKGIVDEYRRPKLSYQTVKSLFQAMR